MAFIGQLTGKQYENFESMLVEERKEAMRRSGPTPEELAFNDIPLEKLKPILERLSLSEEQRQDAVVAQFDGDVFIQLHPEYVDTDHNARLIRHQLQTWGITRPTIADYEKAYESLKGSRVLELNRVELRKQEEKAVRQRATKIKDDGGPVAPFNEDEAYSISMEELRMRANGIL